MQDAYTPALSTLVLTSAEQNAVAAALAKVKPWNDQDPHIVIVKTKIRAHHLARHGDTCCYCRTILHGAGHFMIDREHILPKGNAAYKQYTFATWNLSISCKRCNMQFKGKDDSFLINKNDTTKFLLSSNYDFIHPNFDAWDKYLRREVKQVNTKILVKYTLVSKHSKGKYTYDYFNLKELEINSFDAVQGIKQRFLGAVSNFVAKARDIAARYGQQ